MSKSGSRTADYVILGFLYQFNKTILAIIENDGDATITVEGIVEDIDVHQPTQTRAIQCKYHEAKSSFSLSDLYKPILQMMTHFHENSGSDISYHIFSHFGDKSSEERFSITKDHVDQILDTKNKDLSPLAIALRGKVDVDQFISRLTIEFGPKYDDMVDNVYKILETEGFQKDDIPSIIYPNALHRIANLSIRHDAAERRITKSQLLTHLRTVKSTAISRWTLSLKNAKQLLATRRKQLRQNLLRNARRRYFIISETAAADLKSGIVVFISEYISKYHCKVAHTEVPVFCLDCTEAEFDDIRQRVHEKGIRFNDGYIGSRFDSRHFARAPIGSPSRDKPEREFAIRLLRYQTCPKALNMPKCADLFMISTACYPDVDLKDVNEERLCTESLAQVKYVLGVSDGYN